jgi:hypothetical protein
LAAAAGIVLQLTTIGAAYAVMTRPAIMRPAPVSGTTDKKMGDMDLDSCIHGTGNEWLCTGKDGRSYGCQYDPPRVDRCQRL